MIACGHFTFYQLINRLIHWISSYLSINPPLTCLSVCSIWYRDGSDVRKVCRYYLHSIIILRESQVSDKALVTTSWPLIPLHYQRCQHVSGVT